MMEEMLTVEITGIRRQIKRSDLGKIAELNQWYKETAIKAGIPNEMIEKLYTIRIVEDK